MKNLIWSLSNPVLVILILLSALFSCTMCLENESGSSQQDMMAGSHEPLLGGTPLSEHNFRNYYEMLGYAEPVWKRAPAAGFFGMRGKKVPSSTFYGMRGKKGPSGFLGMRGKKSQDAMAQQLALGNGPAAVNLMGEGLKYQGPLSTGSVSSSGLSPSYMDTFDDYSLFGATGPSAGLISALKRAPAEGFMGLRGKRSPQISQPHGVGKPASSYK